LTLIAVVGNAPAQIRNRGRVPRDPPRGPSDVRKQDDAIAKDDFRKNRENIAEILMLAETLKADFDKNGVFVVDVNDIKHAGRIEKLAKDIKGRLKRY